MITGHIYATAFQLGGQLTASKAAESTSTVSDETQRDVMKVSTALSSESKFVSASASNSKEPSSSN